MRRWTALLSALTLIVATACGGEDQDRESGAPPGGRAAPSSAAIVTGTAANSVAEVPAINVVLTEYAVQLDTDQLPAGPIRLVVRNQGQRGHELQVYPADTDASGQHGGHDGAVPGAVGRLQLVPAGQMQTLDVTLTAGAWELGCHLQDSEGGRSFDHYERGMKTTVTAGA